MPFPTTRWSLLAQATVNGSAAQADALAEFYRRYREPVIAFIRQQPGLQERAEDLAQEFFVHLIEESTLRRADPAGGRFRSFLLGGAGAFLSRDRVKGAAAKRGGGAAPLSFDALAGDGPAVPSAVARTFDRVWAHEVLALARREQAARWAARERSAELAGLAGFLPGTAAPPTYEAAAAALGWPLARLKTEVHRLRQEFRELVRAEVALTVDAPHEIEAEMNHLHAVLADPAE